MAKDYAPKSRKQPRAHSATPKIDAEQEAYAQNNERRASQFPWRSRLWLFCALLAALLIGGFVFMQQEATVEHVKKEVGTAPTKTNAKKHAQKIKMPMTLKNAHQKSNKQSLASTQQDFDFYTLLQTTQVPTDNNQQQITPALVNNTVNENATTHMHATKTQQQEYVLQVAAFAQRQDAEHLREKLSQQGFKASVKTYKNSQGQQWFRVWLGPYASKDGAKKDQDNLAVKFHKKSLMLKHSVT